MKISMKEYRLERFKEKDLYDWDEIINIIQDMEADINKLTEELEDLQADVKDNYKRIDLPSLYGLSDRDFV